LRWRRPQRDACGDFRSPQVVAQFPGTAAPCELISTPRGAGALACRGKRVRADCHPHDVDDADG
jgi:hypothetical protein